MTDEEDKSKLRDYFFESVGHAISLWAFTESTLIGLAAILLNCRVEKAGLVFYSIQNFHNWLNIIDELFEFEEKFKPQRAEWTRISSRLRKLNDTRVRLAHHTGIGHRDDTTPSLKSAVFDLRRKSKKFRGLDFEQIIAFQRDVMACGVALGNLINAMLAQAKKSPAAPQDDPPQEDA